MTDHITGSLDRCVDGETARTILSNTPELPPTPSQSGGVPLQVRTVSVSPEDSSIQVCVVGGVCGGRKCIAFQNENLFLIVNLIIIIIVSTTIPLSEGIGFRSSKPHQPFGQDGEGSDHTQGTQAHTARQCLQDLSVSTEKLWNRYI